MYCENSLQIIFLIRTAKYLFCADKALHRTEKIKRNTFSPYFFGRFFGQFGICLRYFFENFFRKSLGFFREFTLGHLLQIVFQQRGLVSLIQRKISGEDFNAKNSCYF